MEDARLDLWRIMLTPEHEGKGYGTAAVRLVIQYARESGRYKHIGLLCGPENHKPDIFMISWAFSLRVRYAMAMWK